ncbi:MAG TPA: SDR family oxidoreductase [Jatrophihabitans sp.]|jgi:NAD(P)-dependent dehydrogenase (short-subunit alcohol dehydrogenase family)
MTEATARGALVTGGGGGFGKAIGTELVQAGVAVVLMGRTEETLNAGKEVLLQAVPDAKVDVLVGDATKDEDVAAAVEHVLKFAGRIDVVAGTVGGSAGVGSVLAQPGANFAYDLTLNALPAYLAVHHAAPRMQHGGAFVFISSTAAAMTFRGLSGYCAGKAALDQFVRVAADELGERGIRVNAIRPGLTGTDGLQQAMANPDYVAKFTPLIPLVRTGEPEDIAQLAAFLLSDKASWITGVCLPVDGGNELRGAPAIYA